MYKAFKLAQNNLQIATELGLIDINQIEDGANFSVEIFPPNQSKESFENAEFNNIFNIIDICVDMDFQYFKYTPDHWTWEQKCAMLDKVLQGMYSLVATITNIEDFRGEEYYTSLWAIRNKYNDDYCLWCGCKLTNKNRRQDEYERTVCEDCFIQYSAQKKGLTK